MRKFGVINLGIYNLFLATGAIWLGIKMVRSNDGIFAEGYPESWASSLPFDSWVMPGILAIVIFGLGNIIAAIFSFKSRSNSSWIPSIVMGGIFLFGLMVQRVIVNETYIVTNPFLALSVIQICLSGYLLWIHRKGLNRT